MNLREQLIPILLQMKLLQLWVIENQDTLSRETTVWFTGFFLLMAKEAGIISWAEYKQEEVKNDA
jgi:hypothetical protein